MAPPGKIFNPDTGRWVKVDGAIGRRISSRKGKILNPATGRWVKPDGKIGKRLAAGALPPLHHRRTPTKKSPKSTKVVAFYSSSKGPEKVFSNFYPANFVRFIGGSKETHFTSSEQYYHYQKALTFGDLKSARAILAEPEPVKQKKLSRGVTGFDPAIWNKVKASIMEEGLMGKFGQNADLNKILQSTGDAVLAEAAPRDLEWGTGVGIEKSQDPANWRGRNLLGKVLETVRRRLANH